MHTIGIAMDWQELKAILLLGALGGLLVYILTLGFHP
jgi:hypothetical protein